MFVYFWEATVCCLLCVMMQNRNEEEIFSGGSYGLILFWIFSLLQCGSNVWWGIVKFQESECHGFLQRNRSASAVHAFDVLFLPVFFTQSTWVLFSVDWGVFFQIPQLCVCSNSCRSFSAALNWVARFLLYRQIQELIRYHQSRWCCNIIGINLAAFSI